MMNTVSEERVRANVMIVDDDEALRDNVSCTLDRVGCTTVAVASGEACLSELRRGFRGVVLMDVIMPGMDGWTTIQNIVSQGFIDNCVICMVTGQTEPPPIGMELEPFITDYLTKPFHLKDLVSMVKTAAFYLDSDKTSTGT